MLGRDITGKADKIAKLYKMENPAELLTRYTKTLDEAINIMRKLRLELSRNLEAYQNEQRKFKK